MQTQSSALPIRAVKLKGTVVRGGNMFFQREIMKLKLSTYHSPSNITHYRTRRSTTPLFPFEGFREEETPSLTPNGKKVADGRTETSASLECRMRRKKEVGLARDAFLREPPISSSCFAPSIYSLPTHTRPPDTRGDPRPIPTGRSICFNHKKEQNKRY